MKLFNTDALRQVIGTPDSSFANDLITKTLSRHGLLPQQTQAEFDPLPASGMLPRFRMTTSLKSQPMAPDCQDGAEYTVETFQCQHGSREYLRYVSSSAGTAPKAIIMMLHGCTQTHSDFATGTRMNDLAERGGFIVLYPQQNRGDNAQSCWNWFRRGDQMRDRGEPAVLAGLAQQTAQRYGVSADRTFVAGLSAGAAMAVILGQTYPDVFAAVGAHSGLPRGAAKDVPSAFTAMAGQGAGPIPASSQFSRTILFHGTDDRTVHADNAEQIKQQIMASAPYQTVVQHERGTTAGRSYARQITRSVAGDSLFEEWIVNGLGHAWSGGDGRGSYTDIAGPNASAEMARFFFENNSGGANE